MTVLRQISGRPEWLPDHLYPFEDHYLEVDGCRVHLVDEGNGTPLVMLHGNPTWSFLYRNIILGLRERFRCIALDYPGFGLSSARQGYSFRPREHARIVEEVVAELGLREVVLFLHDWGGPIGLWMAQREPERYAGFVLGNTFGWPIDDSWRISGFSSIVGGPIGAAIVRRTGAMVDLALRAGTHAHLPLEVLRCYRRPFADPAARVPIHVFAHELTGSRPFLREVEQGLKRLVDHPTLLVWGELDFAFRRQERMRFEECFPGHELVLLETGRHFIQEEAPETIAAAINEWADLALTHFRA